MGEKNDAFAEYYNSQQTHIPLAQIVEAVLPFEQCGIPMDDQIATFLKKRSLDPKDVALDAQLVPRTKPTKFSGLTISHQTQAWIIAGLHNIRPHTDLDSQNYQAVVEYRNPKDEPITVEIPIQYHPLGPRVEDDSLLLSADLTNKYKLSAGQTISILSIEPVV
ncbi:MAG: hypothetical protein AAB557_05905 [Patescibacteria group bacterium]